MPSARYTLNIKPEDLIPDEPLPQTRKQKVQNWLHYHKWWLIGGAFLLAILGMLIHDMTSAPQYDYQIGLVTRQTLPEQLLSELEAAFATLGEDVDGDGEVTVSISQYALQFSDGEQEAGDGSQAAGGMTNAYEQMAAMTRLSGNLSSATSFLFLTDDPAGLQKAGLLFCYLDGATPAEGAADVEKMTVPWAETPAADLELAPLPLGDGSELDVQEWMAQYSFGFVAEGSTSAYQTEEARAARQAAGRLWEALTGLPSPAGAGE